MKIAIIGTRGIPATYGGFETFAEELSSRLVRRGHGVTVYCRSHHTSRSLTQHNGVKLKVLPTLRHKYLDTVVHTFLSVIHAVTQRFDVVLICNAANAPFIPILRLARTPVAINVDGLERKRRKWNALGRKYYALCERASFWFASRVVTDARVIRDYYLERYGVETSLIVYGAEVCRSTTAEVVEKYGAKPDEYILYLSRLEPENNAALVIEAFKQVPTQLRLLIVGDAPYADAYKRHLHEAAANDPRILFTGFVFGNDRKMLQQNAYIYVHATEVGGTHPALIEAMGYGNSILAYETPENAEVLGDAGILYEDVNDLVDKLRDLLLDKDRVLHFRSLAMQRAASSYHWEGVADEYEKLFADLLGQQARVSVGSIQRSS